LQPATSERIDLLNQTHAARASFPSDLDLQAINTIRFMAVDAIERAHSGHPGLPLGAAPMAYTLWKRFLKHNPANPRWFDRDRFVLSAGHGSMLLYGLLHLCGYDLSLTEIERFRQWESKTPGHPERDLDCGVETTTGPLGQGFGNAVGMAIAEANLAARYNRPGHAIIDHFTYVIAGDGDLMEGISYEAASLAGHLQLGKLIVLHDDNRVTLAAGTGLTFTEDRVGRFAAQGWQAQIVQDGNDLAAIEKALAAARSQTEQPSVILVRTHIGYGSPRKQDSFEAHGSPLGADETLLTKERLGWPQQPSFLVSESVRAHCQGAIERGREAEARWHERLSAYEAEYPELAGELKRLMNGELPQDWETALPSFPADAKGMATRVASGKVLGAVAPRLPALLGGSADLNPSTHTALAGLGDFQSPALRIDDRQGAVGGAWSHAGRNLHFGVREHAMGAILNGLAAHGGAIPFGATFLTFSDYMRPSIRLAALMGLQVIYVFTHDSIALGEDGPTHQSVEHLAALRAIPNLTVIRPADANETAEAWRLALTTRDRPTALVLSRQNLPTLDRSRLAPAANLRLGAYILAEAEGGDPDLILIATGSEVALVLEARDKLQGKGIRVRAVSMPSWELFAEQSPDYQREVLPPRVSARLAVEAQSTQGWRRYVGDRGGIIGIDHFGASAPATVLLEEYGFIAGHVTARAMALLEKDRAAAREPGPDSS
jgi:transketolase